MIPKVEIFTQAQSGMLLSIDDQVLQLTLQKDAKFIAPGSVRVSQQARGVRYRRPMR